MKVNYIYSFFKNYFKKASFYNTKSRNFEIEKKIRSYICSIFDFGKETEVRYFI